MTTYYKNSTILDRAYIFLCRLFFFLVIEKKIQQYRDGLNGSSNCNSTEKLSQTKKEI